MKTDKTTLEDCYLDLLDEIGTHKIINNAGITDKDMKIYVKSEPCQVKLLRDIFNRLGHCPLEYYDCNLLCLKFTSRRKHTTLDTLCQDGNKRVKLHFNFEVIHEVSESYDSHEYFYEIKLYLRGEKPQGKLNENNAISIYPKLDIDFIKSIPEFRDSLTIQGFTGVNIRLVWIDGEDSNKYLVEHLRSSYYTPTLTRFKSLCRRKGDKLGDTYKVVTTLVLKRNGEYWNKKEKTHELAQLIQNAHPTYNVYYDTLETSTWRMYNEGGSSFKIYVESDVKYPTNKNL